MTLPVASRDTTATIDSPLALAVDDELNRLRAENAALVGLFVHPAVGFPGMWQCDLTSRLHSFRDECESIVRKAASDSMGRDEAR